MDPETQDTESPSVEAIGQEDAEITESPSEDTGEGTAELEAKSESESPSDEENAERQHRGAGGDEAKSIIGLANQIAASLSTEVKVQTMKHRMGAQADAFGDLNVAGD